MTEPADNPHDYINSLSTDVRRRFLNQAIRTDFQCFAFRALSYLHGEIEWNWHHRVMAEWAFAVAEGDKRFSVVNLPPRTLKSDMFSAVLPAWLLGRNPSAKIICLSHSQALAEKFAAATRRIMDSAWYGEAFPRTRLSKRALAALRTPQGGSRLATSIGGGVTGRGGDFIILDDPMKADDAESDAVRNSVNDWLAGTLFTRLDDPRAGAMVVVAQRLHQDDPCGRLQEGGGWDILSIPAIATERTVYDLGRGGRHVQRPGDLLHAERLSLEHLASLRRSMGERKFEAQYQQAPVPADGSFFKREWLRFDDRALASQPGDRVMQSWDVAAKTGEGNDWSVCITALVRRSQVIVVDVLRRRLAFSDLYKAVYDQARLHKPDQLLIEDASAGQQLIQMFQHEQPRGLPLPIPIKAVTSKQERALIGATRCERGELVLPERAPWLDAFVNELMAFPAGRHDDQVDALAHLMAYSQGDYLPPIEMDPTTRPSPFLNFARDPDLDQSDFADAFEDADQLF